MRMSYCLPSETYNILLSEEEVNVLLREGYITIHVSRIPCTTSRSVFNKEKEKMEVLDKKKVENCLFFHTDEPVADIEAGDQYVQFLCINVEKTCKVYDQS